MSKKDIKQKKGHDSMNKARKEPQAEKIAPISNQNSLSNKKKSK